MSTELVVQGTYDLEIAQNAVDLVKEELGEDAKIPYTRVKVPSGGSTAWEDPASIDPENPDPIKELRGVIVGHRKVSRLYFTSFDERGEGDSGRPDAWTNDGKIQVVPEETVDYCRAKVEKRMDDCNHCHICKQPLYSVQNTARIYRCALSF
jgi:hypothetical protein